MGSKEFYFSKLTVLLYIVI